MFDTDFSRMGEFFYKEVGSSEIINPSLENFIKAAFSFYSEKHSSGQSFPTRAISFTGEEKSKIYFLFIPVRNSFDLSEFRIKSAVYDFNSLIKHLRGNIVAGFSNLKIDDLKEIFRYFGIIGADFQKIMNYLTIYDSNYMTINSISSSDKVKNAYKIVVLKGADHCRIVASYPE